MEKKIKGMFLGPQAENASELEMLVLEVLRDHVFWRRNFHPGDDRLIKEGDKYSPEFSNVISDIKDNLFKILANIKRGAPLYSPRHIAHIVSDPTLPSLIGYFAGMLYNQNNVVEEVSPETLKKEREYLAALAKMFDYPEFVPDKIKSGDESKYSWGHLCSGGTSANLEALWVIRNLKFFPLSLKLASITIPKLAYLKNESVRLPSGITKKISESSTFELMNIAVEDIFGLCTNLKEKLPQEKYSDYKKLAPNIKNLGLAGFMGLYNRAFPDDICPMPRILISQAQHYCWKKNADIISLGSDSILEIPVDSRIRMDMAKLKETIKGLSREKIPVLAVISICGTTEEASVDPLHRINEMRYELKNMDISFWHHSDAALGGFFAAMLPKDDNGDFLDYHDIAEKGRFIEEEVYNGIKALGMADSITVDPHKFGYQPYPAGAVMFRDLRSREYISYEAPYLATQSNVGFGGFIGQWTLEGSRPGAMALSAYLSQEILSLDEKGLGAVIKGCIEARKQIVARLHKRFDNSPFKIVPFTEPDTTGYCFVITPEVGIRNIYELNKYNLGIWSNLTVAGNGQYRQYEFLISKTEVDIDSYEEIISKAFKKAGELVPPWKKGERLTLLRIFVMNPFIGDWEEMPDIFSELLLKTAINAKEITE